MWAVILVLFNDHVPPWHIDVTDDLTIDVT